MGLEHVASVDRSLDTFLQEEIAIPSTARSSASTSQNYLRNVLRNKANLDSGFPEVLSTIDSDFLGGSFARHTKIWPLDDIDLFLPLDGGSLIYTNNGQRLPFTVGTDSGFTRLDQDRWKTGIYIDSTKVLNGLREGLRDTYPFSTVELDRHCVNIQTTVAATSESEGIGFDVVPCFLLIPDNGSATLYLVPNGTGGWIRSNPRKDTQLCAELHEYHHETYRKAVRLVKYWNKTQLHNSFGSYYIELALSKRFQQLKSEGTPYWYTLHAFSTGMETLQNAYSNGPLTPLIPEAPDLPPPNLTLTQQAILQGDTRNANSALFQAFTDGHVDAALATLNAVFGTDL